MQEAEIKSETQTSHLRRVLLRILSLVALAALIAVVVSCLFTLSNRQTGTPGFGRGILHGALMPMALPNLLLGEKVTIYAPENNGQPYKTGYSLGVNVCGAIFFTFFAWRLKRLRKVLQRNE
jgi:peptidoglycan/LPS O-acetylase OafA/YrhL